MDTCHGRSRNFNPRAPCGARPWRGGAMVARHALFQPTRPLRGATNSPTWDSRVAIVISTHAPLAGRDCESGEPLPIGNISTHAPLAGRDYLMRNKGDKNKKFQPTRPLRGATRRCTRKKLILIISTHAPLAGRDGSAGRAAGGGDISTHAPLAGRDCAYTCRRAAQK